jgi:two-component system response regulator AlgR
MSFRTLIVDDEPLARQRLRRLLDEHKEFECVAEAGDGQAAIDWLAQFSADLVLLDIQMPGVDGLATAARLQSMENAPVVVFCTAYDDHALAAFDVNAADYLLKPIRKDDLSRALARARTRLEQVAPAGRQSARTHISARTTQGLVLTPVSDILYFSADQKYVSLHHDGGELLIDESLKQLEEEFDQQFLRIHRSTLVAVSRIRALETTDLGVVLHLTGLDKPLPVSRRHVAGVKRFLKGV